ncbi:MAG TPA: aminotransferase class I/II-fold pyridoxal phosphate-dependent enzyme [Vicinamibacterales bacterium]|nr:aminotransferase class I/II-fold pyridoxal phosphate-dependent enzyme [Vicinamibacterales bacterium]
MKLEQFAMERMQSTYENLVEFNLSESGVRPLTPRELLEDSAGCEALLDQPLVYSQSNGTIDLRRAIASMYPGAGIDHIEVTNGGSEANFITTFNLIEPGDEVVMLVPNYMQTWGLCRAFGGTIRHWRLVEDETAGRWRIDLAALEPLVTPRTKLIVICNPNNPTGARLTAADLDGIARIADRHGAWILSDEVYRGAEIDGVETASMWGRSERAIITSGLSKAYGLPGLRIGWIVAAPSLIASLWSYHDYVTIAPGALSDRLARVALQPTRRQQLCERTRGILRRNLPLIEEWLANAGGFRWIKPEAGAIVYVRYDHPINSTELVNRLREEKSVLIVPGDHFGMDGYLRLGFGEPPEYNRAGLDRLKDLLSTIAPAASAEAAFSRDGGPVRG